MASPSARRPNADRVGSAVKVKPGELASNGRVLFLGRAIWLGQESAVRAPFFTMLQQANTGLRNRKTTWTQCICGAEQVRLSAAAADNPRPRMRGFGQCPTTHDPSSKQVTVKSLFLLVAASWQMVSCSGFQRVSRPKPPVPGPGMREISHISAPRPSTLHLLMRYYAAAGLLETPCKREGPSPQRLRLQRCSF